MGVMFTEIVSNIYSLVSCLQRLCQISTAWCHVYRDCVKYLQLGVMFTEIVSNIIAWCHLYRHCVKYLQLGVMFTEIVSNNQLDVMFTEIVSNIIALCHVNSIFARQGLRSTPLLSTLGRLSQNFVFPAYRPLAD